MEPLLDRLTRNWWLVALRGVLALGIALAAFFMPGITLTALVFLFGVYALLDGLVATGAAAAAMRYNRRWGLLLLEGVTGILAGLFAFMLPAVTAVALLYVIAAWAVVSGIFQIVAAVRLREEIEGEWLLVMAGAASVLLGIYLAILPGAGLLASVWMFGVYAAIFGVALLALAFRLRSLRTHTVPPRERAQV